MPPDGSPVAVVLADDHVVLRQALGGLLTQHGYTVVGEASDGHTAVKLCRTLLPQVAVLDITMPLMNGIEATREIVKQCPGTKVILLTMHAERSFVLCSLRAGVAGYVLKNAAVSTLARALEAVLAGDIYLCPGVSRPVVDEYLSKETTPADPLSTRERQVLQLVAEGKNMKEIGDLLGISARTAETHRARVMTKLNIHDVAGLVRYAIQHRFIDIDVA